MEHSCSTMGMTSPTPAWPSSAHAASTTIRYTTADAVLLGALGLPAGAALGWFAPALAGAMEGWSWLPFAGPVETFARISTSGGGFMHVAITGVLAAAGLVLGIALLDDATVTVDDRAISIRQKKDTTRWVRAQVAAIEVTPRSFGRCVLSLRDARDADLIRAELDLSADRIVAGLEKHGWQVSGAH